MTARAFDPADSRGQAEAERATDVRIAVFDIDGVVADVTHRLHHLRRRPQNWERFFTESEHDPVLADGVRRVQQAVRDGLAVVWLTGRPSWLREVTRGWLVDAGLPSDHLLMRPTHDYRPARHFKLETLDGLSTGAEIVSFLDDDPDVIATVAAAGHPAELATWLPHTKTLRNAQERSGRT